MKLLMIFMPSVSIADLIFFAYTIAFFLSMMSCAVIYSTLRLQQYKKHFGLILRSRKVVRREIFISLFVILVSAALAIDATMYL